MAERSGPDVILMDLRMPGLGGAAADPRARASGDCRRASSS